MPNPLNIQIQVRLLSFHLPKRDFSAITAIGIASEYDRKCLDNNNGYYDVLLNRPIEGFNTEVTKSGNIVVRLQTIITA